MRWKSFGGSVAWAGLHVGLIGFLLVPPGYVANAGAPADPDAIRLSMQLEHMAMTVKGEDQKPLKILFYAFDQEATSPAAASNTDDVDNDFDDWDYAIRGDLQARKGAWGVGATGFHFDTDAQVSRRTNTRDLWDFDDDDGRLSGPPVPGQPGAIVYLTGYMVSGLDAVADESFSFAYNDFDGGSVELTSQDYMSFAADTDLEVWSVDLYGIRQLIDSAMGKLDLLFGVKVGSLDAKTDTLHRISQGNGDTCGGSCHSSVAAESNLRSTALAGPYLALSGGAEIAGFRIDGQLAQSMIFGDVDYRVRVQNMIATDTDGQALDFFSNAVETFDRKSVKAEVPVTEARIKASYAVNDWMSLGAGGYVGVWWDAEMPGRLAPGDALRGDLEEETLIFLGVMGTVDFRFSGP